MVQKALEEWAGDTARPIGDALKRQRPSAVVTSLFGIEAVHIAAPACPWAVVNSSFYVGPNPPRRLEEDFHPRAVPLVARFASLMGSPTRVLHATDQVFDLSFSTLPAGHLYVGPLGIWEPAMARPAYLSEPGEPWVLVSISSQRQDDVAVAEAALRALAGRPLRVLVTVGPGHRPEDVAGVSENVHVEQLVPHSAVLEAGRLLVSHAGHGSVMKSLWHARPMVLVPWARDQPGVAARAKALGVAQVVSPAELSAESLATAIDAVLENADMADTATRHATRMRRADPQDVAAAGLEELIA